MTKYRVEWSERAVRQLRELDPQTARAIVRFMDERVEGTVNPRSIGHPLRHEGLWRYRVADYRVLCRIEDQVLVVLVVEVGHRREIYR
jgi:mRNA interferase RelE/StbE